MKRKYLVLLMAVALVAVAAIGGSLAAGYSSSENGAVAGQQINAGAIGIGISSDGVATQSETYDSITPGSTAESPYFVQNTAASETGNAYEIYAKVTLYFNWTEAEGDEELEESGVNLLLGEGEDATAFNTDTDYSSQKLLDNGWILAYCDSEQAVLYYTKPLARDASSTRFMDGIEFDANLGNEFANRGFHLDIEVNAVQTSQAVDAIAAEWGVFPVIEEDGTISSVSESRPAE